jgi:homoserine dehydrogenase
MSKELCPLERAIKEAQEMGICEKDPTYDIKGIDTACKIVILANALMNRNVTYKDLQKVEGIENIRIEDLKEAQENGCTIKLIGLASENRLLVQPIPIPFKSKICVDGTLNAVKLETDLAKEIVIIGRGAGPIETASKMLSNLIDIVKVEYETGQI